MSGLPKARPPASISPFRPLSAPRFAKPSKVSKTSEGCWCKILSQKIQQDSVEGRFLVDRYGVAAIRNDHLPRAGDDRSVVTNHFRILRISARNMNAAKMRPIAEAMNTPV